MSDSIKIKPTNIFILHLLYLPRSLEDHRPACITARDEILNVAVTYTADHLHVIALLSTRLQLSHLSVVCCAKRVQLQHSGDVAGRLLQCGRCLKQLNQRCCRGKDGCALIWII